MQMIFSHPLYGIEEKIALQAAKNAGYKSRHVRGPVGCWDETESTVTVIPGDAHSQGKKSLEKAVRLGVDLVRMVQHGDLAVDYKGQQMRVNYSDICAADAAEPKDLAALNIARMVRSQYEQQVLRQN